MAATLSALPIRLGTGALRHPACHISGLHIARQAKSHVVNMAVPKSFFQQIFLYSAKAHGHHRTWT